MINTEPQSSPHVQCYHCNLPIRPTEDSISVKIGHKFWPMCCQGCAAVAKAIVDAGLVDYYRMRTESAPSMRETLHEKLNEATVYDLPAVVSKYVSTSDQQVAEATLLLEDVSCAACVWLVQQQLRQLPGVLDVQGNYTTQKLQVRWDLKLRKLSELIAAVRQIGYTAYPYDSGRAQQLLETQRKQLLKRLGVAAAFGMQVMILSIALYAGAFSGIEQEFKVFFRRLNLLLTLPVVMYAAQPFYLGAWRDIKNLRPGMDVPIALGIMIAFAGSVYGTVFDQEIYFDSVVMFTCFLLAARYFELMARKRSVNAVDALAQSLPISATRLDQTRAGNRHQMVAAAELKVGDLILIRPGESVAADGEVIEGHSTVGEALLSGESRPVDKRLGDNVIAGSINHDGLLTIKVIGSGADTMLSSIQRLLERAQNDKPRFVNLADRIAAWFVFGVLVAALVSAVYWSGVEPQHWLAITISILVISCPCALGLAVPTVLAAAVGILLEQGVLVTRSQALFKIAKIDHVIMDKTGTLTKGCLVNSETVLLGELSVDQCVGLATALERYSKHPIALAFRDDGCSDLPKVTKIVNHPGQGLLGVWQGVQVILGSKIFLEAQLPTKPKELTAHCGEYTQLFLAVDRKLVAMFLLEDSVRRGALDWVDYLKQNHKPVTVLTGDRFDATKALAAKLGLPKVIAEVSAKEKLEYLQELQTNGRSVVAIGDGINDAPVLAAADVSVAIGSGAPLLTSQADLVMLSQDLRKLIVMAECARKTLWITRQNIIWAVSYNAIAVPVAMMGMVSPWMAAIGMSLSSFFVVLNAMRIS